MKEVNRVKLTENTIVSPEHLSSELGKIRQQGYALDKEEKEHGLICVAVPVYNINNEMIAALSAAGPAQRFKAAMLPEYINILKKGATAIQGQVGTFKPNVHA